MGLPTDMAKKRAELNFFTPLESNKISLINIELIRYPLEVPYVLSFDTIKYFESIQVILFTDDGRSRLAEVVPLPGYNDETSNTILDYLNKQQGSLVGKTISDCRNIVKKDIRENPFATSPLLTAIDLFNIDEELEVVSELPVVSPYSVSNINKLILHIRSSHEHETIKIKLSGNYHEDLKALKSLSQYKRFFKNNIRLDANQAYTLKEAAHFVDGIVDSELIDHIEYIEQPLDADDFHGHEVLAKKEAIPIMLDESVVDHSDLQKAYDIGIKFIKLKLFKQGGIEECINLIESVREKKMKVILGNGVATGISNAVEHYIHLKYIDSIFGASEANGFLKII